VSPGLVPERRSGAPGVGSSSGVAYAPAAMERVYAYVLSVAVLVAVASPAFRDPPEDSFPFSDYPMFAKARPNPRITLTNASGVREDGSRVVLAPEVSSGNAEVLQSMMTIVNAVRGGPARLDAFCDEVAARVAAAGRRYEDVDQVEIATAQWDSVAYFERGPEPERRRVHGRCEVPR